MNTALHFYRPVAGGAVGSCHLLCECSTTRACLAYHARTVVTTVGGIGDSVLPT